MDRKSDRDLPGPEAPRDASRSRWCVRSARAASLHPYPIMIDMLRPVKLTHHAIPGLVRPNPRSLVRPGRFRMFAPPRPRLLRACDSVCPYSIKPLRATATSADCRQLITVRSSPYPGGHTHHRIETPRSGGLVIHGESPRSRPHRGVRGPSGAGVVVAQRYAVQYGAIRCQTVSTPVTRTGITERSRQLLGLVSTYRAAATLKVVGTPTSRTRRISSVVNYLRAKRPE